MSEPAKATEKKKTGPKASHASEVTKPCFFVKLVLMMLIDALGLYGMSTYFNPQYGALLQGALLGVIPLIVLFLGLQRFWQSGLAAGAVKG